MSKFESTFNKVLHEEDTTNRAESQPLTQTLDPASVTSDPTKYFKNPKEAEQFKNGPYPVADEKDKENLKKANQWIQELNEFANKLNGTNTDSLNRVFNQIDKKDSIFKGISAHGRTLVQIAGSLADLAEQIRGYIHSSTKPKEVDRQ